MVIKKDPTIDFTVLLCPCGTGENYNNCCRPVHKDHILADTPSKLMRARYSAYSLKIKDFLLATWAHEKRPQNLEMPPSTKWLKLEIIDASDFSIDNALSKSGFVSFQAIFIDHNKKCTLKENSRFINRSKRWYYLEGDTNLTNVKLSGNSLCPCGSGRKYKRCCKE